MCPLSIILGLDLNPWCVVQHMNTINIGIYKIKSISQTKVFSLLLEKSEMGATCQWHSFTFQTRDLGRGCGLWEGHPNEEVDEEQFRSVFSLLRKCPQTTDFF